MSWFTCSWLATPSSTTRAASRNIAPYTRFATKPQLIGWSFTTIGFLPQRRATASTRLATSGAVAGATTISAKRITYAGEAQCQPITRSGRPVAPASATIGNPEVSDARIASGPATSSSFRNISSFRSSRSGTHSITRSQAAASSRLRLQRMRARAASASAAESLPRATAPAIPKRPSCASFAAASSAACATSVHTVAYPATAVHCAMLPPITPAPITPMLRGSGIRSALQVQAPLQRRQHSRVEVALEALHHRMRLRGEACRESDRAREQLGLRQRLLDDARRPGIDAAVATARRDHLVHGPARQARREQRRHAGVQEGLHVDLGHAEEAALGAHQPVVMRHDEDGAGAERVAVAGGDGDAREREDAAQDREHLDDVVREVVLALAERPLEVEAVRVEPPRAGRDERLRAIRPLDLVEGAVPRRDRVVTEAVLAVGPGEDEHLAFTAQLEHVSSRRGCGCDRPRLRRSRAS